MSEEDTSNYEVIRPGLLRDPVTGRARFAKGNRLSPLKGSYSKKTTHLVKALEKYDFSVIDELVKLYRDPKTTTSARCVLISKLADKIYPSLKAVDISAEVQSKQITAVVDVTKLTDDELKTIESINPTLLTFDPTEDDEDED